MNDFVAWLANVWNNIASGISGLLNGGGNGPAEPRLQPVNFRGNGPVSGGGDDAGAAADPVLNDDGIIETVRDDYEYMRQVPTSSGKKISRNWTSNKNRQGEAATYSDPGMVLPSRIGGMSGGVGPGGGVGFGPNSYLWDSDGNGYASQGYESHSHQKNVSVHEDAFQPNVQATSKTIAALERKRNKLENKFASSLIGQLEEGDSIKADALIRSPNYIDEKNFPQIIAGAAGLKSEAERNLVFMAMRQDRLVNGLPQESIYVDNNHENTKKAARIVLKKGNTEAFELLNEGVKLTDDEKVEALAAAASNPDKDVAYNTIAYLKSKKEFKYNPVNSRGETYQDLLDKTDGKKARLTAEAETPQNKISGKDNEAIVAASGGLRLPVAEAEGVPLASNAPGIAAPRDTKQV